MERIAERLLYLLLFGSLLGCGPNAWRDWPPNVAKVRARM